MYDFTHISNTEQFIQDNIEEYIRNRKNFTYKKYCQHFEAEGMSKERAKEVAKTIPTYSTIEVYLTTKFKKALKTKAFREKLKKALAKIKKEDKKEIIEALQKVAVKFCMEYADIEGYYIKNAMEKLEIELWSKESEYRKACLERFLSYQEFFKEPLSVSEEVYIKEQMSQAFIESVDILLKGGFKKKLYDVDNGIKSGTIRSNEGDAAQFIFVARAILAGFSCSNVDVRTSPYDAVIDYNTFLLRVQVKGINHDRIQFYSSPRGGAGADTSAPTNISKEITRNDCDLYVAVEKSNGICYIIPIGDVEDYIKQGKKSLPEGDKKKYREKWELVEREAKARFKIK